jgi:4-hydroxybenzoate polyprenyltransferase
MSTPPSLLKIIRGVIRTMRPHQWIKNVFIFGAMVFSEEHLWRDVSAIATVVAGFFIFCAAASSIYLLNDVVDVEKDRAHPRKRNRPVAAGIVPIPLALVMAVVMLIVAVAGAWWVDGDFDFMAIIITYLLIQGVLYSYFLKNIVIVDIFTIAAGFVLRAIAGALVLDIAITPWLLLCMGLLAIFLGLGKRRAELSLLEDGAVSHRKILQEYSIPMIDQMLSIVTAATIMAYTLFTFTSRNMPTEPYPVMLLTVPMVIYAIFRYIYLIHQHGAGGSPEELVLKDIPFAVSIVVWGATVLGLLLMFRP